jgi:hypothetical protein
MRMYCLAAALVGTLAASVCASAQDFQMQEVSALPPLAGPLAPRVIVFTDHRNDELVDPATGLIRFADWERSRPQQKQLLTLFPSFEEAALGGTDSVGNPIAIVRFISSPLFAANIE